MRLIFCEMISLNVDLSKHYSPTFWDSKGHGDIFVILILHHRLATITNLLVAHVILGPKWKMEFAERQKQDICDTKQHMDLEHCENCP